VFTITHHRQKAVMGLAGQNAESRPADATWLTPSFFTADGHNFKSAEYAFLL
jgi:hypothetical protein